MALRTKFNVSNDVSKRTFDGITFDSEVEMKYYQNVILPQIDSGEIIRCERQKKFILQPKFKYGIKTVKPIEYVADFVVLLKDGKERVIDIKGCADCVAKIKRKMFWFVYPDIDYDWIGYSKIDGGWVSYETIQKGRKLRKKLKREEKEHRA